MAKKLKWSPRNQNDPQFEEKIGRIGKVAELGSRLTRLCEKAFKKFDKDGSGIINRADVEGLYTDTDGDEEKDAIGSFLKSFPGGEDGEITKPEFLAYCLGNRNMCPNDEYYLVVFQNGWKLNEDAPGGGSASTLNLNRVEAVLRDKIYQRSEGSGEKAMKGVFKFFDTDGSGKVELKEFGKAMERFGIILMDDEMEALFKKYDVDNSGAMDYQEFIKGLMSVEPPETSNG